MNPNSFRFFGFLLCAVSVYSLVPGKYRRTVLLLSSILFYLLSAPKQFWILSVCVLVTYGIGLWLEGAKRKKPILALGLLLQLGSLFAFKYLTFFGNVLQSLGLPAITLPSPVLPLGISFYCFVSCGYLMDVYRGKTAAVRSVLEFSLFISFFPAILSGPIERAEHLLPQLRNLNRANGEDLKFAVTRLLTGLLKKVLLADSLAILVNTAYASPADYSAMQLMLAAIAYSLQIYFDFSAYSDMAIGAARLFGIRLLENFRAPYLADSCKDFWRRWHISLSTWFRDYLYFPLGGSRRGNRRTYLNILIVFTVSGLWHGAAWSFVVWGLLCGLYQVVGAITEPWLNRLRLKPCKPFRVIFTFGLTTISWIFFRADSIAQAVLILRRIFTAAGACFPISLKNMGLTVPQLWVLGTGCAVILLAEGLEEKYRLRQKVLDSLWLRYALWAAMLLAVALFGAYGSGYSPQEFVYFQF